MDDSRDGQRLSVGDDEQLWDAREMRVFGERCWAEGWESALDAVGARRRERGGSGFDGMGDLRRLVGERFAAALEGVWEASLRQLRSPLPGGGGAGGIRVGRDGFRRRTGLTDRSLVMRGAASAGGQGVEVGGVIRDEAAMAFKAEVERKIRKLTREMETWLELRSSGREENGSRKPVRRCGKCKRYMEESWKFCPLDGQKIQ